MASAWAEFRLETFGDPYLVWHDGADYDALLRRWRGEPSLALAMLRLGLAESDPVAAGSVEYLASHGADVGDLGGLLREVLPDAEGRFRVRVATALLQLTGNQDYAGPVCDVLVQDGFWGERIHAAIALSGFAPTATVIAALVRGVQDEEYTVRRHSAQSLRILAGRKSDIERAARLWSLIRGDDPQSWREASTELSRPWAPPNGG